MLPERREVDELYHAALQLSSNERHKLLSQADPEIRIEVETLLAGSTVTRLPLGSQLGPYRIEASIGRGGMGEVYRARDTRLGRTVAIKTLPHDRMADPERKRRFLQEARAASALNHPHIVTLYDIAQDCGVDYQVMEYVEGRSLDQIIKPEGLPVAEAIDYARQIAGALAAANSAGVVHRDVKPSNVIVTKDSHVKLLDFGLAKLTGAAASADETRTNPGVLMGTAAYMSPEQAAGMELDHRTDIFSLGVVLYEMIAGRRPFHGKSSVDLMHAIIHDSPQPPGNIPPHLDEILAKALKKNREERYQNAGELANDLRGMQGAGDPAIEKGNPLRVSRRAIVWGSASALGAAGGVTLWNFSRGTPPPAAISVAIPIPEGSASADPGRLLGPPVVAPDGSAVVVSLKTGGGDYLFSRRLDSNRLVRLEGTKGASYPFWSPNSQHIGFFAERKLQRLPVAGGAPAVVCEAPENRGGAWGAAGVILIGIGRGPLLRVAESGGEPVRITQLDEAAEENSHRYPVFLPDGERFLYFARADNLDRRGIYIDSLSHKQPRRRLLVADGQFALGRDPLAGGDYLLTQQAGKIVVQPFRSDRGELTGEPRTLLDRAGQVSVSNTGVLVLRGEKQDLSRLVWQERAGREVGTLGTPTDYWSVALSSDDRFAAVVKHDYLSGSFRVWVATLAQGLLEPFSDVNPAESPVWPQNGTALFYSSPTNRKVFRRTLNPRSAEEVVIESHEPGMVKLRDISPDQRFMALELWDKQGELAWRSSGDDRLHRIPVGGTAAHPRFSPDGRWLAYVSNLTGNREVYVMDFPNAAASHRLSTEGGSDPHWRRDGKELFYLANDDRMMSVDIHAGTEFSASTAKPLFRTAVRRGSDGPLFDATSDGSRFLIISGVENAGEANIEVVLNWLSLLR